MPLDEEGAKWSCEPCIRGHRSSKCQHFDRLMMKVPKAGRPLAKCPHPKGSCSCERAYAFMVRIPKGSTCLCRPLYQVPSSSAETPPSLPNTTTPTPSLPSSSAMSMTTSTPGTGKVQKHTRKPSNFQYPSKNIIKELDSEIMRSDLNNEIRIKGQSVGLDRSTTYTPVSGSAVEQVPASTILQNQMQETDTKPIMESKAGGCCSGEAESVTPPPQQRSCCEGTLTSEDIKPTVENFSGSNPAWTGSYDHPEHPSWSTHLPNNNFTQNPTYTPINQNILYNNQSHSSQTLHGLNPGYQDNPDNSAQSMEQFFFNSSSYPHNIPLPFINESNHDCSCGDGCQCLGCASHPFNETTRQHVQEMGYMMTLKKSDETPGTLSPFAGPRSPPPIMSPKARSNYMQSMPLHTGPSFTDDNALPSSFENTLSSPTFATDQFMHPSEYYTLEYPVGLSLCSNTTGTCKCGNDCNCVGCLTHSGHDGVILESLPTESPQKVNEDMSQHFREYYNNQGADVPRSMDQYSASALSPPVVEALLE